MRFQHLPRLSLFALLILVFYTGCTSEKGTPIQVSHSDLEATPSAIERQLITKTMVPSPSPTITPTTTQIPPTPTFLPTIPSQDPQRIVLNLYATNGGCEFPCWWGIAPGETMWESAGGLLENFAMEIVEYQKENGETWFDTFFEVPLHVNSSGNVFLSFRLNEASVVDFIMTANPWRINNPEYSLSYFLSANGPPSEVRINAWPTAPQGKPFYHYYLYYEDKGILAEYGDEGFLKEGVLQLCPQRFVETPRLWLWDPSLGYSFDYLDENLYIMNAPGAKIDFRKIEDVSAFDVDQFYKTYLDPNTEVCIETPVEYWD